VERTARVLQDTLGGDVTVASPEARGEQAEQLTLSLRAILLNASLIAIVVGGFVVYHMVAVSLCERRRSAAVANAVGVSPRAFVIVTLLETAALAGIGAVVGVAGGRWIGRMAAGTIGGVASDIWLEVDMLAERSSFNGIVAAIVLGIGGALCAAGLALRATFRASTIDAMRPSGLAGEGWDASRIAPVAGAVLLAATWGFAVTPVGLGVWPTASVMTARYAIGCAGVALLAPWLVSRVGRTGLRIARRSRSVAARLAMASLPRTPGRSGSAVATVAAAVAITVNLASLVTSFQHAWLAWLERHFAADLMVGGGDRVRLMAGPAMAAEVADRIGNIPGVAGVEPFRVVSIVFGDRTVFLQGLSTAQRLAHGGLPMVEGNLAAAAPALEAGTGVLLSDNLAYRLGLHRGDDITLPMPGGPRRARVEGTFVDFMGSLDLGSIVVATSALAAHWGDTHANLLRVWLAPGASVEAVRARIRETLGGQGYYVLAGRQFLDGVRDTLDRFFVGAWAMIVVSGLVGVVGIGAAQAAAVLDREAELKTLRMVGVSPRTLRRSIIGECGLLGGLGGAIGVALGLMLGVQMVRFGLRAFVGWSLPFVSPGAAPLAGVVAAAAGCSILAGWFPARAGSRLEAEAARID
jgi:putative ABC transport system permease protein